MNLKNEWWESYAAFYKSKKIDLLRCVRKFSVTAVIFMIVKFMIKIYKYLFQILHLFHIYFITTNAMRDVDFYFWDNVGDILWRMFVVF